MDRVAGPSAGMFVDRLVLAKRRAGRQVRHRHRDQGAGRRQSQDHRVLRLRLRFHARAGPESQFAVAEVQRQDLHARDRFRARWLRGCSACARKPRILRAAAASSRSSANSSRTQVVAPGSPQAATLMDDVMMSVPYGFLRAASAASDTQGDVAKPMGGKKYTVLSFTAATKLRSAATSTIRTCLSGWKPRSTTTCSATFRSRPRSCDYKDFGGVKFPTSHRPEAGRLPGTGSQLSPT